MLSPLCVGVDLGNLFTFSCVIFVRTRLVLFLSLSLKASALVRIVCLACPSIKPGVELLGKALQLADRDKMADHVEHVRERGMDSLSQTVTNRSSVLKICIQSNDRLFFYRSR